MDQTGIHLVPAARFTYERAGSKTVAVVGAEDKRQITVCVAASLRGDLLPLQLIFQGKTSRSLPPATANSIATLVDVTQSSNRWYCRFVYYEEAEAARAGVVLSKLARSSRAEAANIGRMGSHVC
jgi:hypothetical protein